MGMLARDEIAKNLDRWQQAWNEHDLDRVMALFHDDVVFENWTGARVSGKRVLCRAWGPWFVNHGGFRFIEQDMFIDEAAQKVLLRWRLEWPLRESGYEGRFEKREGVDVLHFCEGKIIRKLTYSKTVVEIGGERIERANSNRFLTCF